MRRTIYDMNYFLILSCLRPGMFEGDVIRGVVIHRDIRDLVTIKSPRTRFPIGPSRNHMAYGRVMFLNIIERKEKVRIKPLQKKTESPKGAPSLDRR